MTSGAVLVIGNTLKIREKKVFEIIKNANLKLVEKENPDLLVIKKEKGKNSIGIDLVRKCTTFLSTKAYSAKNKAVIIHDAHLLTSQAQNALLKTLEEPPAGVLIVLSAKTENSLLPTVVSRCRKIHAERDDTEEIKSNYKLKTIKMMDFGQKLELAQEIGKFEKEEIVLVLEDLITQGREEMLNFADKSSVQFLKRALEIKKDIEETNVNARLALETIFINLN